MRLGWRHAILPSGAAVKRRFAGFDTGLALATGLLLLGFGGMIWMIGAKAGLF